MPRTCKQCKAPIPSHAKSETLHEKKGFCSIECQRSQPMKAVKKPKKPVKAKKKPKTIARLRNDVAELLQKLVRLKAADENGMCKCWTCPTVKHWKEMQGGHFIERGKTATKIVEENIHPQCPGCNQWGMKKSSTVLEYRNEMVNWYGEDFVKELEAESKRTVRHTRTELMALIEEYRKQVNELEKIVP